MVSMTSTPLVKYSETLANHRHEFSFLVLKHILLHNGTEFFGNFKCYIHFNILTSIYQKLDLAFQFSFKVRLKFNSFRSIMSRLLMMSKISSILHLSEN